MPKDLAVLHRRLRNIRYGITCGKTPDGKLVELKMQIGGAKDYFLTVGNTVPVNIGNVFERAILLFNNEVVEKDQYHTIVQRAVKDTDASEVEAITAELVVLREQLQRIEQGIRELPIFKIKEIADDIRELFDDPNKFLSLWDRFNGLGWAYKGQVIKDLFGPTDPVELGIAKIETEIYKLNMLADVQNF